MKFAMHVITKYKQQLGKLLFVFAASKPKLRWIYDCLSNRSQAVVLGGTTSNILPVVSGAPQGSVLGPLLFLIYIDQVASSVTYSNITMYADDIAMYKIISNPSDYTYLQEDILSLCSWIACQQLPNSKFPEVPLHDFYQKTPANISN